ncbi:hypothetical protein H1Z61_03935 [Bacillus aquiflavi]|uniref:Uncharacterized protein n=1 Tax=Bacillus aquiflavi TaxID=2672567 RepID=A0A6B3VRQ9_9BACI|nr:hypothetical protein [Bacillus aquiflavi]MBA4536311.1 hypothetical protein [Bacillus aquiflavi]NEY80679.1 hypothetical protein [Bacillus aquiflavi]UAC48852.1 hypothetical protein K6959_02580 [Bacillus aquiflavi]
MDIVTQQIEYEEDEVTALLKNMSPASTFTVDQLVYYPYSLFQYAIKTRRIFKAEGKVGCTIELISGRGSIIQNDPSLISMTVNKNSKKLLSKLSQQEAAKLAKQFINDMLMLKLKFLTTPTIQLVKNKLFYRPYWIVTEKTGAHHHRLIVDAISLAYHPLS